MKANAKKTLLILAAVAVLATAVFMLLPKRNPPASLDAREQQEQAHFAEIAKNSSDVSARRYATAMLKDQAVLTELARNEKEDVYVRMSALENITNQVFLASIAKNEGDCYVCVAAFQNLTDQALLLDIATNSPDLGSRAVAANRLNDRVLAEELGKHIEGLRRKAHHLESAVMDIKHRDDQENLMKIAEDGEDEVLRQAAKERLEELRK